MSRMRLDKLLSMNGVSRSQAIVIVRSGAVTVNGEPVLNSATIIETEGADVRLNGKKLRTDEHLHVMIHKPSGYLTATEDKKAPVVADLLPELFRKRGVGPVGRLDKDVTGLVFMTTDGQLAHRLISPKWEQDKLYRAEVEGRIEESAIERFAAGIPLKDFTCRPAKMTILEAGEESARSSCRKANIIRSSACLPPWDIRSRSWSGSWLRGLSWTNRLNRANGAS